MANEYTLMKPDQVTRAQRAQDAEALSAMGRRGAKIANERRAKQRDLEEVIAAEARERQFADMQEMADARRDDLVPPEDR